MATKWIPEIMYEESEEGSSHIPFIMVPTGQVMPHILYIFESRDTGEQEPGLEGEPVPVFEWDLHQYADMASLLYESYVPCPARRAAWAATVAGRPIVG